MHAPLPSYVCATRTEWYSVSRRARRSGRAALVGLACYNGNIPTGDLLSWGFNGSLVEAFPVGTATEGITVVDMYGKVIWERGVDVGPSGLPEVIVLAAERVIDDPRERRLLHEMTGAHVVDMESGILARTGRLKRIVRVVTDNPSRQLHLFAFVMEPDGTTDPYAFLWAFKLDPWGSPFTLARLLLARHALRSLRFP